MTTIIRNYVQNQLDNALIRSFYDAKENDFNPALYSSVYLCVFKNKIINVKSKQAVNGIFDTVIKLNCDALRARTKTQHLSEILKYMSNAIKLELQTRLNNSNFTSSKLKLDYIWQYLHKHEPLKCQDYFENFLQSQLRKIRKSLPYLELVDGLSKKLYLNSTSCSEYEQCMLITDVIKSSDVKIASLDIDKIVDEIYMSNILVKGI